MEEPDEVPNYMANLQTDALKGANIGVLRLSDLLINSSTLFTGVSTNSTTKYPEEAWKHLHWAGSIVDKLGANVVDEVDLSKDSLDLYAAFFGNRTKTASDFMARHQIEH